MRDAALIGQGMHPLERLRSQLLPANPGWGPNTRARLAQPLSRPAPSTSPSVARAHLRHGARAHARRHPLSLLEGLRRPRTRTIHRRKRTGKGGSYGPPHASGLKSQPSNQRATAPPPRRHRAQIPSPFGGRYRPPCRSRRGAQPLLRKTRPRADRITYNI